jgi:perosamine synthetase
LGLSQLSKLQQITSRKQEIHTLYQKHLGDAVEYLNIRNDFSYIPFRVVVFVPHAEAVMNYMKERGIEPRSMFYPLHRQPCYADLGYADSGFEHSMRCFRKGICLPTWVGLTAGQIQYVSETLKEGLVATRN